MSDTVQLIVNRLNQEPFNKGLTLVSFDRKIPVDLIQILQDVIEEISADQRVNLREETPDQTAQRMFDFLWVLKYKSPLSDADGLANGDKNAVHPVLAWLLPKINELRKRAYLAKYLLNFEVPGDMISDEVYLEFKQRQLDFKETHKLLDGIRNSDFQPSELKTQVQSLEDQKMKLTEQLSRLKKKFDKLSNLPVLLEASSALRRESEEQKAQSESLIEQQSELADVDQRLNRTREKLKEMQSFQGGVQEHMIKMQEEVKTNAYIAERLPQELNEKKEWRDRLRSVLNQPSLTDQDRNRIQTQIQALRADVKRLTTKRDSSSNQVDDQLAIYRQKNAAIEKKRELKNNSLRDIQDELTGLEKELKTQQDKLEEVNPANMLKGEELDNYVQELRKKTTLFKKYRAEQSRITTETGTLRRTLEILQQSEGQHKDTLTSIEEERGISGYQDTQERIEEISALKSEVDETKGKALEEISKVVSEINQAIKEQKAKLAPLIKDLRTIRTQYQEMEDQYEQKKALYENATLGINNEQERVLQERVAYEEESVTQESRYHFLHSTNTILEARLFRATSAANENGESYKDLYSKATQEQEQMSKGLREQQKQIKETHEPNLLQIELFTDLKKILKLKLKLQASGDSASLLKHVGPQEVDRLVL